MIGKLLLRGMLAGVAAGLLTFGFAKIAGAPPLTQAIAFEETAQANKGEAPGAELVSRKTQAGLGLFTGEQAEARLRFATHKFSAGRFAFIRLGCLFKCDGLSQRRCASDFREAKREQPGSDAGQHPAQ